MRSRSDETRGHTAVAVNYGPISSTTFVLSVALLPRILPVLLPGRFLVSSVSSWFSALCCHSLRSFPSADCKLPPGHRAFCGRRLSPPRLKSDCQKGVSPSQRSLSKRVSHEFQSSLRLRMAETLLIRCRIFCTSVKPRRFDCNNISSSSRPGRIVIPFR